MTTPLHHALEDRSSPHNVMESPCLRALLCVAVFAVVLFHAAAAVMIPQANSNSAQNAAFFRWGIELVSYSGFPLLFMVLGAAGIRPATPAPAPSPTRFYGRWLPPLLIALIAWSVAAYLSTGLQSETAMSVPALLTGLLTASFAPHLWVLYTMLGIVIFLPFVQAMDLSRRRHVGWWFVGITFSFHVASFLSMAVWGLPLYHRLADGFLSVFLGYTVLGWLLSSGSAPTLRWTPLLVLAVALSAVVAFHWLAPIAQEGGRVKSLFLLKTSPFTMLLAACTFLLCRQLPWQQLPVRWGKRLASLSALMGGAFLSHVLILQWLGITDGAPPPDGMSAALFQWPGVLLLAVLTFVIATLLTALLRQIPLLRRIVP